MVAVIGTRDLIPPQGRVSVELFDPDTGRVLKKVQAENAIMDWLADQIVLNGGRGHPRSPSPSYDIQYALSPLQPQVDGSAADFQAETGWGTTGIDRALLRQPGAWPFRFHPMWNMSWLWATPSTHTPNSADTMIPVTDDLGEVTAGCQLHDLWAPDGVQVKRGTLDAVLVERTWDRSRIVAEFGPGQGTGVYRSIGIGSLISQEGAAPGGLRVAPAGVAAKYVAPNLQVNSQSSIMSTAVAFAQGAYDADKDWIYGTQRTISSATYIGDMTTVAGASSFIHGYGTTKVLYAPLPGAGNLYLGVGQTLYRGDRSDTVPYHVPLQTIDISASLGAETILDLTHNSVDTIWVLTETRVFTFNTGTNTVTGNWAHNLTMPEPDVASAEYDSANDVLWLSTPQIVSTESSSWGFDPAAGGASPGDSLVSRAFTPAGADVSRLRFMGPQQVSASGANADTYAPILMADGRWMLRSLVLGSSEYLMPFHMQTMGSHALLPSDVTKAADKALRITYDFTY